jgi:hypothetical protein
VDQPAQSDRVAPIEGGKHACGDCGEQVLHEASYHLCTDMLYCVIFHHYWRISNEVYALTLLYLFSRSTFDGHALRLALRLCFVTLNFSCLQGALMRCTRCRVSFYCDQHCQEHVLTSLLFSFFLTPLPFPAPTCSLPLSTPCSLRLYPR